VRDGSRSSTNQQVPATAPAVTGGPTADPAAVDGDLTDVDGLLGDVDGDLASADAAPADSD
jgi:hypothetical protein